MRSEMGTVQTVQSAARSAQRAVKEAVSTTKSPVRARWRRRVLEGGVDDTAASAGRSVLVVAPHPDDETIGCGATMARKRAAGTEVDVALVTDGRHSHRSAIVSGEELGRIREGESVEACGHLGVPAGRVHLLGYEELTLWDRLDAVTRSLAELIEERSPDEVLVASERDWHADHQAVNHALREAVRRTGYCGRVAAYPVWFWADGPWRTEPWAGFGDELRAIVSHPLEARRLPRAELVSTAGFTALKREAFALYRSQVTNLTGEATWQTFPPRWIEPFVGPWELFFPVETDAAPELAQKLS
ncbi:MAG: PIG-L family deacetylase [Acidimicrobiia bacterium]|nr:PIG-L family deacetylase [Acidimicrobiia bacterium]